MTNAIKHLNEILYGIYVCPDCGSENVVEPVWAFTNVEVYDDDDERGIFDRVEGIDFDLCIDCQAQMRIILKTEYLEKEHNNA